MKKFIALATAAVLSATVLAAQAEKESAKTAVQTQTKQVPAQTPAAGGSFTVGNTAASDVPASAASAAK